MTCDVWPRNVRRLTVVGACVCQGFFVFAYCFFYYFERSSMFGFMQTSFFFGYMLMASYAAFIMLGTIGFVSSFFFVRRIYAAIKCD